MPRQPTERALLTPLLRRVFPSGVSQVARVAEGVSTRVYRVAAQEETFYLRILPEADASFGPEVVAHERVRQLGVRAPEVIAYEPRYQPLQRSIMIVREIPGLPLSQSTSLDPGALSAVMEAAGSDLARINSVGVDGFGWIRRDAETPGLRAPLPTHRTFALDGWESDVAYLADTTALLPADIILLEQARSRYDAWLDNAESRLAHGDFDTTAIYQRDGVYAGIIDFGELRGASRWYDLAHFHMRDGEYLTTTLLPPLMRGYAQVVGLPQDALPRVRFASLFINLHALSRSLRKRLPNRFTRHQVERLRADLAALAE
jgi:aminoglycoside phosphotransferase (APT) family kinase protein